MDFHRENIEKIVTESLNHANVTADDLDAIAVTNRPGLKMSLQIGLRYAKHLARKHKKPLIPVHHMEAHALTVRMENDVQFPFLCLLISGGHSLLAFVEDFDKFKLIGESLDDAPGECFDKIARFAKLRNLPNYEEKNGGQSIEDAARECREVTDKYKFPLMLARYRDCQFSYAGLKNVAKRYIKNEELKLGLDVDCVIPDYPDFCANFLGGVARHICNRSQRAIAFCERKEMFKGIEDKKLVISGGVACNDFIFTSLTQLCEQYGFTAVRPSKKLCTDNGIMIAWNGVERFTRGADIYSHKNIDVVASHPKCQLGVSLIDTVKCEAIHCHWAKIPILKPFLRPGK